MSSRQIIYGYHALLAALTTKPSLINRVMIAKDRHAKRVDEISELVKAQHIPLQLITKQTLNELCSPDALHQNMAAELRSELHYTEKDLEALVEAQTTPSIILVLDGVQDPHNLGACLRSALAFNVAMVIVPKNRAVGITATVRKVACGAADLLPVLQVTNLARTLKVLQEKNFWLVGGAQTAKLKISDVDLTGNIGLVMGGEAEGLRRLTQETCDYLASIPMPGNIESLNVSVATGICLYEIVRQRY